LELFGIQSPSTLKDEFDFPFIVSPESVAIRLKSLRRPVAPRQIPVCVRLGTLFLSRTNSHISTQDAARVLKDFEHASNYVNCVPLQKRKATPETRGILVLVDGISNAAPEKRRGFPWDALSEL